MIKASLSLFLCLWMGYANSVNSIDGYWRTVDDSTGHNKAVVEIDTKNQVTYGTVVGGYPVNGVAPHEICTKCPSPFINQPVTGMQILWGMTYNVQEGIYEGGKILDPDSGHVYHALLISTNNGQRLKVHGYIGLPIIGRTQIWYRLTPDEYAEVMKPYSQS